MTVAADNCEESVGSSSLIEEQDLQDLQDLQDRAVQVHIRHPLEVVLQEG